MRNETIRIDRYIDQVLLAYSVCECTFGGFCVRSRWSGPRSVACEWPMCWDVWCVLSCKSELKMVSVCVVY